MTGDWQCMGVAFRAPKKNRGGLRLPGPGKIGTPLTMVCRTTQAFPTSTNSAFVLPFGCRPRTLPSAFLYRRAGRLSQGTANPFRATRMVRPLCLAEPGRGGAPCTTGALAVFFHPPYRPAGQPSGIRAFRSSPVLRPVPSFRRFRPFGRRVSINGSTTLLMRPSGVKDVYPLVIHKN
jgi:hypothetical protein